MKSKLFMFSALMAFVFTIGLSSCGSKPEAAAEDPWKTGTHVAAKWTDGNYWGATISGNSGGKYQVKYDDGTTGEVTASEMKSITPKEDLKVGDKVWAVWMNGGKMYKGSIQELQDGGAIVKWDDGSEPSMVPYTDITK